MSELTTYLVAIAVPPALGVAWVAVQRGWRRSFPRAFADPDVLAERRGCSGCEHAAECALTDETNCEKGEDPS